MSNVVIHQALIMAAGRGNRMRPLTDSIPKPMIPYNGDTLIGNSLTMLQKSVNKIHITVGYKKAMLAEYLMARGVDTVINTEGHGNAWWITNSIMKYINEPILVLTTDNITKINTEFLNEEYIKCGYPHCMVVPVLPIPGIDGDYIEETNNVVKSIQREVPYPIYCSGIQVLNPARIFSSIGKTDVFYLLWKALIDIDALYTSGIYPDAWYSVDTLEQLSFINQSDKTIKTNKL